MENETSHGPVSVVTVVGHRVTFNANRTKAPFTVVVADADGGVSDLVLSTEAATVLASRLNLCLEMACTTVPAHDAGLWRATAPCGQCPHPEESHEHIGGKRPWMCHECDDGSASPENLRRSYHAAIPAKAVNS